MYKRHGSKLSTPCPRCGSVASYGFEGRWKRCSACGRNNSLEDSADTLVIAWRHSKTYGENYVWDSLKFTDTMKAVIKYLKMLRDTRPDLPLRPKFRKFLEAFDYVEVDENG